ncbi:MAG TPA: glucose-6-phosphate isomerase [Burkholderiales bacterium]|nr:glucose-6-phosphate isomerase [Burkholderiales bacterium]
MNTTPPTECPAWAKLAAHAEGWKDARLAELFAHDPRRAEQLGARAPGLLLDYSRQRAGALTLRLLAQLLEERGFADWRAAMFAGEPINVTEGRAVRHPALRAGAAAPAEVTATLERMGALAGSLAGVRRIVHLGTGGSDLGARLLMDALGDRAAIEVRFAANIDPLDLSRALEGADPASTWVVAVSKTFTTAETIANARAAREWLGGRGRLIAVTANEAGARAFGAAEVLPMWDWVGGRFSIWSAASFSALAALGAETFEQFLAGGRDLDEHFLQAPPERNVPVLLALLGAWNVNFLGAATHCVLPYANALRLLPAYLQQLEMESNGKRVDREGRPVAYATAPVVWGAEGTVSQHSFHQLLHQGTQAVPCDFIVAGVSAELDANAEAQARALAFGTDDPALPPHRRYPGNRPSSTLRLERLDARPLGRLVAAYEHKVFTQGVLWNVNSFDQWGVELGKQLAGEILKTQGRA